MLTEKRQLILIIAIPLLKIYIKSLKTLKSSFQRPASATTLFQANKFN